MMLPEDRRDWPLDIVMDFEFIRSQLIDVYGYQEWIADEVAEILTKAEYEED